ncbi:conjugal transfer protein TrbK [Nostoc sp. 3335mG]|nr:conjugal transfer protein TrbK [Nostoc sp. 3335mG]
MEGRTGKLAITAAIVGLIVAATIAMSMSGKPTEPTAPVAAVPDKAAADRLDAELQRCNQLGPTDKPDQACLDTWAEARRHFLGSRP